MLHNKLNSHTYLRLYLNFAPFYSSIWGFPGGWDGKESDLSICKLIPTLIKLLLLFSCWVVSNSLWPHELQHMTLPCPLLSPQVCSNSCPLSQWCHLTILSSVTPFSCPQSFLALGSFPMSSSHQVAKVLELQLQHWSFQWLFRVDFL